jgi:polysaccharide chain length determinant protein (PEP-CTERM system associated)
MEASPVHALDYVNVFLRRKWWLIAPVLASIVVGALLVQFLPKEYESSATLAVAAPVVSPSFFNQSAPLDASERQRALSQQLVSLPILARVVKEEGLGSGAADDPALWNLHRNITISVPDPVAPGGERRLDTFIVSYIDSEPARAQRIANRLVGVFVDENSRSRAARAENTSGFVAAQLDESQQRLNALEAQLRDAKESHMGQLPEQTAANLQTLSGLRQQLEATATALRGEQDRLSMIERQIDALKEGGSDLVFVPRAGGATPVTAPDTRVQMLQHELAEARTLYTDRHPEVRRLEEELTAARRDAAAARTRSSEERTTELQSDPAYRQLSADREMARLRIRDLQRAEVDARRQIGVYQARVERAPRVEQQLAAVQREYDLEKQQYAELSSKRHAAEIAERVERNRRGEQFQVLYPATYPNEPVRPVPWRVMVVSILAGIVLGGAATLGREYLDRSVHDVRDLKDEFDLPVVGEIGRIQAA